jgi:predicted  nucleic acid-binding Zn-ribbon protein
MELQLMLNIAYGIVFFLGGFILNRIYKDMEAKHKEVRDEVKKVEAQVFALNSHLPANYVTKEELRHLIDKLFDKLDKISDKLDDKQDKTKS